MTHLLLSLALAGLALSAPAADGVPTLSLAEKEEPGELMVLEGQVADATGAPLSAVEVEIAQTGADGHYRRGPGGMELGSGMARLKGKVKTDAAGRFRLETIRPGAYPGKTVPAHIHFHVGDPSFDREELTVYFQGDPHLPAGSTDRAFDDPRTYVRPTERDDGGVWRVSVELRPPKSRR